MTSLKNDLCFAIKNGFVHIFSSSVLSSISAFLSNIAIVRLISKELYGQLAYADNILGIFMLFNGIGACSGVLQYISTAKSIVEKQRILKLAFLYGESFNFLLSILAFTVSSFVVFPVGSSEKILQKIAFLPLVSFLFEVFNAYFRATLQNTIYSILCTVHSILLLILSVVGVYFVGILGVITARYVSYLIIDILGLVYLKKEGLVSVETFFSTEKAVKKDFLSYSVICMLSNSASGILYLADTFLIGMIIRSDSVIADYKIACGIPAMLNFIPSAILTFLYPYFARIKEEKKVFNTTYVKLLFYLVIINGVLCLLTFVCAPIIIKIVYGISYSNSALPMRILIFGAFFGGTFRIPGGNITAALGRPVINLYNTLITGLLNIVLDIILIINLGSVGAAISTSVIYILSGGFATAYLFIYMNRSK